MPVDGCASNKVRLMGCVDGSQPIAMHSHVFVGFYCAVTQIRVYCPSSCTSTRYRRIPDSAKKSLGKQVC